MLDNFAGCGYCDCLGTCLIYLCYMLLLLFIAVGVALVYFECCFGVYYVWFVCLLCVVCFVVFG